MSNNLIGTSLENIIYNSSSHEPNGRVNIQGQTNMPFMLFQDNSNLNNNNQNENTSYNEAMTGNWVDTPLSKTFFSLNNIQIIQNGIRAGVYRMSQNRFNVSEQDDTNLKIIMRSIFLQHATYNINQNISEQINILNNKVFDYCIPNVYNEAIAYMKYKNDVSTLVTPMDRPMYSNVKGDNPNEFKRWF